ncbi:MAG TPA: O-methyltransferase, partial [Bryobacteraceae bacterium]|nr:O-methyltransferase [Bryobacteraceae bacterium]
MGPTAKRWIAVGAIVLAATSTLAAQRFGRRRPAMTNPPVAETEAEKRILSVLESAWNEGNVYLQVPAESGRLLRLLTEATNAKNVVEIGTSTGYSGLWFCLALQKTGGRLTTFEIDRGRAAMARKHFEQAGVDGIVTIVEGDAHETISRVKDSVDILFLDADKEGYLDYFNKLYPLVRPGGLIVADNVGMAPDYMRAVTTNPKLDTVFF